MTKREKVSPTNQKAKAGFILALIVLCFARPQGAFAMDTTCPNTNASRSAFDTASALEKSLPTRANVQALIVSDINLSTAYTYCATKWAREKNAAPSHYNGSLAQSYSAWAIYNSAVYMYTASEMEHLIGSDYTAELQSAYDSASDAIDTLDDPTLPRIEPIAKLRHAAKALLNEIKQAQKTFTSNPRVNNLSLREKDAQRHR